MIVNVAEAKANLSKLINLASQGQEVVIAKNNVPLVDLVVHQPRSHIKLGLLESDCEYTYDDLLIEEDKALEATFYSSDITPK